MLLWNSLGAKARHCGISFYQPRLAILDNRKLVIRACVAAVFAIAIFALQASAGFVSAPSYPAGSNPVSVAVGDFNRDSFPDLANPRSGEFS
jgi:hypothetical protein